MKSNKLLLGLLFTFSIPLTLWKTTEDPNAERTLSQFAKTPQVIKKKSNIKKDDEVSILLSDPAMSQQWGLHQIDIKKALKISQGSPDIVIAVIDTGIDISHPDLKNNLWVNPGETGKDKNGVDLASNGIDDDQNGCIDDVYGCNFINNKGDYKSLTDNHGHGSHISGIIAAEAGNGVGVVGVAPKVQVMTLKYYDPQAKGANNLMNTVNAIHYAVKMKKKYPNHIKKMIINYSGGGLEYSRAEFLAVEAARKAGILFVAAAGNERSNSDKKKYYPASYDLDNIISVTANNPRTQVLPSSNYGVHTVDIAAPGENIYSTLPGGSYGLMTGTSQATAFATGVAALIMARFPDFSVEQTKKYILKTGDDIPSLKNLTGTSKRLNSYRALVTLDSDVNAMGAIAKNTAHMQPQQFTANPHQSRGGLGQMGAMAVFGKELLRAVKQKGGLKKLRRPNKAQ